MSESRCNVVHVEDGEDGSLKLYLDDGLFVRLPEGEQADLTREQWKRDGVLFIAIPTEADLEEE